MHPERVDTEATRGGDTAKTKNMSFRMKADIEVLRPKSGSFDKRACKEPN